MHISDTVEAPAGVQLARVPQWQLAVAPYKEPFVLWSVFEHMNFHKYVWGFLKTLALLHARGVSENYPHRPPPPSYALRFLHRHVEH